MKVAFIFDTVLLKDENENYYAINLNYKLWNDRYLKTFDSMIVSTRMKKMEYNEIVKKKGYTISNGKNVEIFPITMYKELTDAFLKRKKIKEQLKKVIMNVDCVIIRLPSPLGNLACDVCRECNRKYAIEVVACAWNNYRTHGHWAGKLVAPYMFLATRKQCKKAKRVLYVTEKFLQQRYPTNGITTNASNVMINETSIDVLTKRIEKIKNKKNKKFVLGLVGSLDLKYKGHEVALQALEILVKKYPDICIEFLGNGENTKLKELVSKKNLTNHVIFKGTLPAGKAVLEWMDYLDILVIPSFTEGLPRVLIEAMSRGCPSVGSNAGGIPELIQKEVLHNIKDYKKLANDIEKIIENKDFAILLAQKNFQNAKQYYKENLDLKRTEFWNDFRDGEK